MLRSLLLLLIAVFFQPGTVFSQITDDFSDGNVTSNPAWTGSVADFVVNAGELQLDAAAAGNSTLSVQGNIADSSIWNLHFRLGFAPSTQNYLRIYLLADQADLVSGNGYFLEIGETGSQDALRFFRQDAGVKTLLATGQAALVATNPNISLRVKRTASGEWSAEAAPVSGALQPQFTVSDATYGGGTDRFFGFHCVYTASNIHNFFFDDVSILPDLPDTTPPVLLHASVLNDHEVLVVFDENLDATSAAVTANYQISGGVGQPESAILQADNKSVLLTIDPPLATGNYTLQVTGIADAGGNIAGAQSFDFQYINIESAEEFDIVINEIMSDPGPSVGLPEVEWLELFNRSDKIIDLSTLRISESGGSSLALPAHLMYPQTYAVLTAVANVAVLRPIAGDTVLAGPLSSTALNNESDIITITHTNGNIIDRVAYSTAWHTDAGKEDGGWSLERINPDLPCLERINWSSCPVTPGGTPGKQNASFENTSDTKAPQLLFAIPENSTEITLTFNEGLDESTVLTPSAFQLIPARNVQSVTRGASRYELILTLSDALQPAVVYAIVPQPSVLDCSGNAVLATDTVFTGLPEKPTAGDVIINEILFNPPTNGARYVEILNRSNKIFRWSEFFLASFGLVSDIEAITTKQLFLPGKYYVFTADRNWVINYFQNIHPLDVITQSLPSLTDNEDNITLYWAKNGQTVVLDSLNYSDDWHNGLFSTGDRDGVALERIRESGSTNDRVNWTSASPIVTGAPGTPTLPNSQRLGSAGPSADDLITLPSERLSPDDDAYEDFLEIQYNLPQDGYAATMTVFDASGIPVRRLVRQDLIGTEGSLRWDGESDKGERVRPGVYILFLEIFSPSGDVKNFKRSISVVRKF